MDQGIAQLGLENIVVMDDHSATVDSVAESLAAYGANVFAASNAATVEKLALLRVSRFYILDINMGLSMPQEGIIAARKVRNIDKNAFVAILTGTETPKDIKERLDINHIQHKSDDIKADVRDIVYTLINQVEVSAGNLREQVRNVAFAKEPVNIMYDNALPGTVIYSSRKAQELRILPRVMSSGTHKPGMKQPQSKGGKTLSTQDSFDNNPPRKGVFIRDFGQDPNIIAYKELYQIEEWRRSNTGKFVAFIEGVLVSSAMDIPSLFSILDKDFPGKRAFVVQVKPEREILDFPTPFEVENS